MPTKAAFKLICAKITGAEKEAIRDITDNARIPLKNHTDVIHITESLKALPTLAVIDESIMTHNELKAFELELLEPVADGKLRLCAMCGQVIGEDATMCTFCGTEIGKSNEVPSFEVLPVPLTRRTIPLMRIVASKKPIKHFEVPLPELVLGVPEPIIETSTAIPDMVNPQPWFWDWTYSAIPDTVNPQADTQSDMEIATFEAFEAVECEKATRVAKNTDNNLDILTESELYMILSEATVRLKPLLMMAREYNIDVSESKHHLSEVIVFSRKKETKKAVTAMLLGEKSIKATIKLNFLRNISLLENEVAELRSAWVGVARAQKLIISAKDFLNVGEYLEVPMNLDDARIGLAPFKMAVLN